MRDTRETSYFPIKFSPLYHQVAIIERVLRSSMGTFYYFLGGINMKNPLLKVREEKSLTANDLAMLAEISVVTVQKIEWGSQKKMNLKVLDTVEQLGYDKEQFMSDMDTWKEQKLKEIEAKIS
jgi:DNA-binding XRE family transcriptional regulator